ncbi:hypothetical protein CTI12_AA127910 [Artemisia annua]|uniref:Uncharacterized protein n=1 Tax=Artemisia annua TaxID=35608 RepID=A0A2U1P576_ARTAN|nr:hypothetical protein CTI12_AA127910 [Artemisia annua]
MSPKFARCLEIANQIGDRRVEKVLEAVFTREKNAYLCDEKDYNQRIEELKVRIEHRHEIYKELKKHGIHSVFDECLSELKAAEKVDFEEMGWLIRRSYAASLRVDDKNMIVKKLRSHFDATACIGLECLEKAQARNGDILQALIGALDLARAVRDEKREHVMLMDVRD